MERVLITGGAGFIGKHLALALIKEGHTVTIYDNFHSQVHADPAATALELQSEGIEILRSDIRDSEALARAVSATCPHIIVHLAAETGTGQSYDLPARYCDVNVTGTAHLVEAIRTARRGGGASVKRVVLASSRAVYGEGACLYEGHPALAEPRSADDMAAGDFEPKNAAGKTLTPIPTRSTTTAVAPASVYASTKLMQEYLLRQALWQSGVECAILRLQNVYGAGQVLHNPYTGVLSIFARQLLDGATLRIFEDGKIVRDFVYVSDVVEAFLTVCRSQIAPPDPLDIGTGQDTTILEVAQMMMEALGLPPERFQITGEFRPGDIRYAVADIADARAQLGWVPAISLREGVEKLLTWTKMVS